MRVLIVTQYYPSEPVPRPAEWAPSLKCLGHDVTVICPAYMARAKDYHKLNFQ